MKESDKKTKWKIIEINKQLIAHKTKKAYLIQLSSGIYKYYKFWYPKALLKNENNKLLLIYSDDFTERRKIFLDKNTENEMTISEIVKYLRYEEDNLKERVVVHTPEPFFKEVIIDEELLASTS